MLGDWISNLDVHIPNVLGNGIPVLVYSGTSPLFSNAIIIIRANLSLTICFFPFLFQSGMLGNGLPALIVVNA